MTPRSLVGMTMGARKRAARNEDDYTRSAEYLFQRTKYRIGQRLRPCPGNGCRLGQSWCLRCDGTGVVSAKPKKVRR